MEKFKGLKDAIKDKIYDVNKIAEIIEDIENQVRNKEIVLTDIGSAQLIAFRNIHNRIIKDIEDLKNVLAEFEKIN
jgi:hypothetical protein